MKSVLQITLLLIFLVGCGLSIDKTPTSTHYIPPSPQPPSTPSTGLKRTTEPLIGPSVEAFDKALVAVPTVTRFNPGVPTFIPTTPSRSSDYHITDTWTELEAAGLIASIKRFLRELEDEPLFTGVYGAAAHQELHMALLFLFIPIIVELSGGPEVDSHITQLIGFTLILIAIFGNAYFDATRIERRFEEDRKKEIRTHQMKMLGQIESWTNEFNSCLDDIRAIRELSDKDPNDDKLIVRKEDRLSIADSLIRLDSQRLPAFAKAADILGISPTSNQLSDLSEHNQGLLTNLYILGSSLSDIKEMLTSSNKIPATDYLTVPMAQISQSLDKIRQSDL